MGLTQQIIKGVADEGMETLGKYYSFYRGFVSDNRDPENLARVKVLVPGIIEEDIDYWAWPLGKFSGKGYGINSIPQIGSTIYVAFELGDPSQPLWLHGWQGEGERTAEESSPYVHSYTTPGGASISVNDETQEVIVTGHTNTKVHLNEKGVSIELASSEEKIFLGNKDKADEPAVLGDTLEKLLKAVVSNQMSINEKINDLADNLVDVLRDIGASSFGPVQGATMVAKATTLAVEVEVFKATVNKHNKSIEAQYKRFKDFKSETVDLNK